MTFSHFAVVYALDDDTADEYLIQAEDFGWTVAQLRAEVFGEKQKVLRFTLETLRARAEGFTAHAVRNNGPRFLRAYLDSLEKA